MLLVLDQSLRRFDTVWAAAGHPNAVFQLSPQALAELTAAPWVDVAESATPVSGFPAPEPNPQQAALAHLRALAAAITESGELPSPCISVCQIDSASGRCEGCYRTLDEIAAWSAAGPERKRAIWRAIAHRLPAA